MLWFQDGRMWTEGASMATTQHVEPKLPYEGKFWMLVAPPVRHYIKKLYGSELARKAYKGGKPLYRELIDRAPAIGAGNPMATNLYLACVVFAMWKACDGVRCLTEPAPCPLCRASFPWPHRSAWRRDCSSTR